MFMRIHIFINATKRARSSQRFVSLTKYYNRYYTLDILYTFVYSMHSVNCCARKFSINTSKFTVHLLLKVYDDISNNRLVNLKIC